MKKRRLTRAATLKQDPRWWYMYYLPETLKTSTVISHLQDIYYIIQQPSTSEYVGMSADECKRAIEVYEGGTVDRVWLDEDGLPVTGTEETLTAEQFMAECDE